MKIIFYSVHPNETKTSMKINHELLQNVLEENSSNLKNTHKLNLVKSAIKLPINCGTINICFP